MSYQTRLWSMLLCVSLAVAVVASCKPGTDLSQEDRSARVDDNGAGTDLPEEDRRARVDDNGADKNVPPQEVELFPDTKLGLKLREHMLALALPAEMPEDADRRYTESLAELRKSPQEVVKLLAGAYRKIEPTRYFERWCLAKTLADLEAPAAYETLPSIARTPLPPERNKDPHHFSTQEEEVIIRLRAVDGLALLAAQGHEAAKADLLSLAIKPSYPNRAIQTRAIKGYLRSGSDYEARAKLLRGQLPKEMHSIVTIDVTPQKEFEARVSELASIAKENTTGDAAEERLPDTEAPEARRTPGGQDD